MIKDFEYLAPATLEEALSMLSEHREEAKIIAGGQSLLIPMRQGLVAPEYLIDIKGISSLEYIDYDDNDCLRIGALTIHRDIEKSPVIREHYKALYEMEQNLATVQTRNWGTIGGNLCHGDPAGDPAIVFIALRANLKLARQGQERTIEMEDFSKDYLETALAPDEILTEIQMPKPAPNTGVAHNKLMAQKGDMGIIGAAVSITLNPGDGTCQEARIALSNASSVPLRARQAESILIGKNIDEELLSKAGEAASIEADPPSDVHGSTEYRREMIKVFVKRVATSALERARTV
jgi:carbon-monoxide dehydrogenase medium subunit